MSSSFLHSVLFSFFLFCFLFLPVQAQQKKEKLIELLFCVVLKRSGLRAGLLSLLSPFVAGFLQVREAAAFFFFFSLLTRPRFGALSRTHFFPSRQFILGCVSSAFVMCKVSSAVFIFDAFSPCLSLDQHC